MPRRTILGARQAFEMDVLPVVSDYQANAARQVLEAIEADARRQASQHAATIEADIREAEAPAVRELAEVRDAIDDLRAEGLGGRISARDYGARLDALAERQVLAEERLRIAEGRVAEVEAVETAPLEWFDSMQRRLPALMSEVPW
jgi:hypothetical protein